MTQPTLEEYAEYIDDSEDDSDDDYPLDDEGPIGHFMWTDVPMTWEWVINADALAR